MKSMIACIGVPGRKMPEIPISFSLRDVLIRNDAADDDDDVVQLVLGEQLHHTRADVIVRA